MTEPSGPPAEMPEVEIIERVTLHKYEGDPTQEDIDAGIAKPLETVILEKGQIVEHTIHGQEDN